jgi:hypothetical protein
MSSEVGFAIWFGGINRGAADYTTRRAALFRPKSRHEKFSRPDYENAKHNDGAERGGRSPTGRGGA